MKKYILLLSVAVLGLTSCSSDYLDTAPESSTDTGTIVGSATSTCTHRAITVRGPSRPTLETILAMTFRK